MLKDVQVSSGALIVLDLVCDHDAEGFRVQAMAVTKP